MKTFLSCVVAALLVSLPGATVSPREPIVSQNHQVVSQDKAPNLVGVYELHGVKADGTVLAGIAIIKPRSEKEGYLLQFTLGIGNNLTGVGVHHEKSLAVALIQATGVLNFSVSKDGKTLDGRWTELTEDVGTMTLRYIHPWPTPKEGT